jgi:hypothetical protein
LPSGSWLTAAGETGQIGAFAAGVGKVNPGLAATEMFYPAQYAPNGGPVNDSTTEFWAIPCGAGCKNGPLWSDGQVESEYVFHSGSSGTVAGGWNPGGVIGVAAAMFTDPPLATTAADGQDTTQYPWVINTSGNVFVGDGGTGWTYLPTPEPARWITDHYILGASGEVYLWNGTSNGKGNATWSKVIGPLAGGSQGIAMHRIAASQAVSGAFAGQSSPIGPSKLWGVDASGNVYWAEVVGTAQ